MNIFQKIRNFFKPYNYNYAPKNIRAYIIIDEKREVLGEYKNVTPDELDERIMQDQANYTWKLMKDDPRVVCASIEIEEMQ
jgi:hypothetical protein